MNAFLESIRAHVVKCLNVQETSALRRTLELIDAVPELQGACCICFHEADDVEHVGHTLPLPVVRCAKGCRGCSECVAACSEGTCGLALCQDCSEMCSGCAERFCQDHLTKDPDLSDTWCEDCCPGRLTRKLAQMEAGDRAFRAAVGD